MGDFIVNDESTEDFYSDTPLEAIAAPLSSKRELALQGMRRLYGPTATFKSTKQQEMVEKTLELAENFIVVIPTGGGKSLSWLVPAVTEPTAVTAVVVPFKSLLQQHLENAQRLGIQCCQWTAKGTFQRGSRVIFLAAESIGCLAFIRSVTFIVGAYGFYDNHLLQIFKYRVRLQDRPDYYG
jgi:superfamily II DNA helicase RecQ